MIAIQIIGGLLLVWIVLELCGLGVDWVEAHWREIRNLGVGVAMMVGALWGVRALFA